MKEKYFPILRAILKNKNVPEDSLEIIKKDDILVELKIKNDPKTVKKIKAKEPILLYLPNDYDKNEIKINYNGIEKLNYGMKKDTKIGYIDISYKNNEITEAKINFIKNVGVE